MAGLMTYGRRQFEHLDVTMRRLIPPFRAAVAELTAMVDADARAFEAYLVCVQADRLHWPYGGGPEGQWGQWTVMGGLQRRERWSKVMGVRGRLPLAQTSGDQGAWREGTVVWLLLG